MVKNKKYSKEELIYLISKKLRKSKDEINDVKNSEYLKQQNVMDLEKLYLSMINNRKEIEMNNLFINNNEIDIKNKILEEAIKSDNIENMKKAIKNMKDLF